MHTLLLTPVLALSALPSALSLSARHAAHHSAEATPMARRAAPTSPDARQTERLLARTAAWPGHGVLKAPALQVRALDASSDVLNRRQIVRRSSLLRYPATKLVRRGNVCPGGVCGKQGGADDPQHVTGGGESRGAAGDQTHHGAEGTVEQTQHGEPPGSPHTNPPGSPHGSGHGAPRGEQHLDTLFHDAQTGSLSSPNTSGREHASRGSSKQESRGHEHEGLAQGQPAQAVQQQVEGSASGLAHQRSSSLEHPREAPHSSPFHQEVDETAPSTGTHHHHDHAAEQSSEQPRHSQEGQRAPEERRPSLPAMTKDERRQSGRGGRQPSIVSESSSERGQEVLPHQSRQGSDRSHGPPRQPGDLGPTGLRDPAPQAPGSPRRQPDTVLLRLHRDRAGGQGEAQPGRRTKLTSSALEPLRGKKKHYISGDGAKTHVIPDTESVAVEHESKAKKESQELHDAKVEEERRYHEQLQKVLKESADIEERRRKPSGPMRIAR